MGLRHLWCGFGVAICLLTPALSPAQEKEKGAETDLGAPGEEHKRLAALAGDWDVALKYKVGPGVERDGTASCESRWALGGRFLRQEYSSKFQGMPFTVVQYLGYDRRKKKFIEIKMDSMDTSLMHNEGSIAADGKTITCTGDRTDPESGKELRMRTVTTLVDKDHYTLEWFFTDADGKEERVVTLKHTRKKA